MISKAKDFKVTVDSHVSPTLIEALRRPNKAHTATGNRIARRYNAMFDPSGAFDIVTELMTVEVETTANMASAIDRLADVPGRVYVAVTNREGIDETLRIASGSRVGVMDPQGNILRESC
ncbi:MAG: hypothetical protein R3E01_29050 [Pirellulaceae bacterium]|nr:hypothetical protein [Planctomycetales bacterium]